MLEEARPMPVAAAAPVPAAIGEAGRGPADQSAEHEARDQEQQGDDALAAHRPSITAVTNSGCRAPCGITTVWAGSDATCTAGSASPDIRSEANQTPSQRTKPAATAMAMTRGRAQPASTSHSSLAAGHGH